MERGGWARPLFDNEALTFVNEFYQRADAFLFGRRTYEIFAGSWGTWDDPGDSPIWTALNKQPKYVASTTLTEPRWADTTVLSGDLAAAIGAAVRNRRPGPKDVASECRPLRCPGQWPGASVHVAVPCSKTPGAVAPNQLASKRSQPAYQKVVENPKAVSDRRGDSS